MFTGPALTLRFDFFSPPRIVFGWGRRSEVGTIARELGRRAWPVVGSRTLQRSGAIAEIAAALRQAGVEPLPATTISREPKAEDVDRTVAAWRQVGVRDGDLVLAVGGGSAIDLAKAAAGLVTQRHEASVRDYLEGVGRGLTLIEDPLPVLALPTTAGTGSEATKNAVISSFDPPFKKSLRSQRMVPRAVLVDPELTVTAPQDVTRHTGMDAITQLFESYVTRRPSPVAQTLALSGLRAALPALPRALDDGADRQAREAMAYAALLSGIALANSGLGMAHGVAAALGVHCRVPHGLACAVMLPTAVRVNRGVREAEYARLAAALRPGASWPGRSAAADAFVEEIDKLYSAVEVPCELSKLGVRREQIPALVQSSRGNSMNGNPRELSDEELWGILEALL